MRKLIAAINMTLDGFCDHTAVIADDELHQYYTELLSSAGAILYGRITYQLMEYWQSVLGNPTGNKAEDDFAEIFDRIPKIVFSRTMKSVEWESARLANHPIEEEILELRQAHSGNKDIFLGSPSIIVSCMNLNLIDEFQLCIHPVVLGKGLPLFKNINDRASFKLLKTKTFGSGAIVHYYEPLKE